MEPYTEDQVSGSCKYINRDLSWLEFNRRVLEEAQNENTPLLERAKFLAIVSTNLDEFISVRAAGIRNQIKSGVTEKDFSGYSPPGLMKRMIRRTERLVADQYATFRQVSDRLESEGIVFTTYASLSSEQQEEMNAFFFSKVFPALKPIIVSEKQPFPLIASNGLYYSIVLKSAGETSNHEQPTMALLEIPLQIGRYIDVAAPDKKRTFILLEQLIKSHIPALFHERTVIDAHLFRIIRDADLPLEEGNVEDLLYEVERKLRRRLRGAPVRLEIEKSVHPYALEWLQRKLDVYDDVALLEGPIDISYLMKLSQSLTEYDQLRYAKQKPMYPQAFKHQSFFEVLQQRDVAVFHPYESFDAFNDFIAQAARDPLVSAIKMTLYRVSKQSKIIRALVHAAESGKRVTVVVELKARFDEERNIAWAKKLELAGCHVIHGWIGLKIHAKMTLIERREPGGLKRYIHVSTGNYNGQTAKIYTDIGLFTSQAEIADDIGDLFNEISGFLPHRESHVLAVSPTDLRMKLYSLIHREMNIAASGRPARIIGKMNSLSDPEMINKLYEASRAGVKIDLIVRGICCLCPGVPDQSENITVRSIIDRYLEHSRVFCFANGGHPEVWLSSADWMNRNLSNRIEVMCPVIDQGVRQVIIRLLMLQLKDNVKAHQLLSGGKYRKVTEESPYIRSQYMSLAIINARNLPV
ncbi:polyphosphate kinase 1 [Cohnella silvisoli]|uniref:Polyphosphate kinase n=1 Tax=Cohnella silvisoli TaxID=2873699 RepID=A0ABV1KUU5_9BACL|nr:polyphosphate kinase 1 [Cohnella silvisoli]MCD9023284.1 polyphosphate kinase 1 [Cohnella silvisoli]